MKVKSLKANQTEIELDGKTVFVSYKTPVAAFISGVGIVKTSKKWSQTTSKHVNQWIRENYPHSTVTEKDQSFFDSILD